MSNNVHLRQVATLGPGPILPSSSTPPPGLPISTGSVATPVPPITTAPGLPISTGPVDTSNPGVVTTTVTGESTTVTLTLSSNSFPSSGSSASTPIASSPSPSSPSSTSPSTPSSTPLSWKFALPANLTTCDPVLIRWSISNPSALDTSHTNLQITVTNTADHSNKTLVSSQPLASTAYPWPAVDVPPGQYALLGASQGTTVQSPVFSVQAGSNTSCIPNNTTTPVSSTAKSTNVGAIAGGTVGGVLILACAGVAFFFLCGMRARPASKRRGIRKGWGGLGSFDSKAGKSGESNDYLGAVPTPRDFTMTAAPAPAGSTSSLDAEKTTGSVGLPVLAHHANWSNGTRVDSTSPSVELGKLRSTDSPRSSFDFPDGTPAVGAGAGAGQNRRSSRTPRKPVPTYDPTPEELDAMAMARSRSDESRQSRSSNSHHQSRESSAFAHHQGTSSLSGTSASHDPLVHGLRSKSSGHFNEMHYLIPDMPVQPRGE